MSPSGNIIEHLLHQAEHLKFEARHEEALLILEQVLLKEPNNVEALEEVTDNELSLEHYERAEAAAQRVIALEDESFSAHYVLGFVSSHREDWKASIRFLQTANVLEPNHPEILRCLGWSLFASGKETLGVVTLERALNLEEANPLILCDLGVVYLRLKNFPKARALLERALDIDPLNTRVRECLDMARRIESTVMEN